MEAKGIGSAASSFTVPVIWPKVRKGKNNKTKA
jgi:hypothetical protein